MKDFTKGFSPEVSCRASSWLTPSWLDVILRAVGNATTCIWYYFVGTFSKAINVTFDL
jgi:hypothetical protein